MGLHILIDGYNLIRQSSKLSALEQGSLQEGREALLERVARYRAVKGHSVTVVFDAAQAPVPMDARTRYKGVTVLFSPPGQSADSVIKRLVNRERDRAVVVTSDREIVQFAVSRGAAAIDSPDFEQKMNLAAHLGPNAETFDSGQDDGWTPTTKKRGPSRRPSKRARRTLVKTRNL